MGSALMRIIRLAKSDYYLRHVSLFLHVKQLGSLWTDFREI